MKQTFGRVKKDCLRLCVRNTSIPFIVETKQKGEKCKNRLEV